MCSEVCTLLREVAFGGERGDTKASGCTPISGILVSASELLSLFGPCSKTFLFFSTGHKCEIMLLLVYVTVMLQQHIDENAGVEIVISRAEYSIAFRVRTHYYSGQSVHGLGSASTGFSFTDIEGF